MLYIIKGTTFIFEPGQDWKIAALRITKCVCFFKLGDNMDWMDIALEQAKKAYKKEDVPVGAVIVKNNKMISKAYNKKEKQNNAVKHAEMIAIEKACKKLHTWHLEECVLYVTLEPCMMCAGAIIQSRIKKIVYAAENPNHGFINSNYDIKAIHPIEIISATESQISQSSKLLRDFFKEQRK